MATTHASVRIRAVVIDDSAQYLESARQMLADCSCVELLGCASSGAEGIGLVAQVEPELVLIDMAMPGMNGLEVTRRIRRDHGLTRVLMMSGHRSPAFTRAALEAGADAFVHKPDLYNELRRLVAEWFGPAGTDLA